VSGRLKGPGKEKDLPKCPLIVRTSTGYNKNKTDIKHYARVYFRKELKSLFFAKWQKHFNPLLERNAVISHSIKLGL
jgi:hypothetical protein